MQLIDSHCHINMLDMTQEPDGLQSMFERAQKNNVGHMLCVGVDLQDRAEILEIAEQYANVDASVGLHPNERVEHEPTVEELVRLGSDTRIIAIGETGLDYYRSKDADMAWQQTRFRRHIQAAKQLNKAIIVHSRYAPDDTIRILEEENATEAGVVLHCFTESWEMAEQALAMGCYISFSGIITFKNAGSLREVVKQVPIESMLIETDCPYLAPEPFRGKQNEPALVRYVAEKIAELKQLSLEDVANITTSNYYRLFDRNA